MPSELKVTRILFATDFLESSRLALDYAVAFAEHFKATIVMLHVIEFSQAAREVEVERPGQTMTRKFAKERLETLAASVRRIGLPVETYTEDGLPCKIILSAVERYEADLLVLGVHGVHRGIEHLLLGSNTEKILLASNCPTLTVGSQVLAGVDPELHLNEVIYFSDFTPEATAAAPYALFYGKEFDVPVEVCQLLPAITENNEHLRNELAEEYCARMKQILPENDLDWCKPAFQLARGMEIEQIIERTQGERAGLIVLGVRTESQLGRHLHTSFAYHLLAKATCPVLTIRHNA